jgi:outer membrane lipoprotein SlyB
METNRTHPLILTAAAAVIITCGVAVASVTGLWPSSRADESKKAEVATQSIDSNNTQQHQAPANIPPLSQDRAAMNSLTPPMAQAPQMASAYPSSAPRSDYSSRGDYTQPAPQQAPAYPSNTPRGDYAQAAPAPMYDAPPPAAQRMAAVCHSCGRVVAVHPITIQGESSGIGAVAGGVAGALLGNQLGKGHGRQAFTIAGAAGGAYLGNNIEKNRKSRTVYDVQVRFEDGRTRKYRESHANWQVGDRVRVHNGRISSDS